MHEQNMEQKIEGKCNYCEKNVYSDHLFVEEDEKIYHLYCYNTKVKKAEK